MFKKLFTTGWVALLFVFCELAAAAAHVSVTATPTNPTAPANVTLAVSGDTDGNPVMATKVEYFNGSTSLGVSVQSPFTLTLTNLAAGTYQISVKVTTSDPANPVLQSAPLAVTIGTAPGSATAYFIHTDQLNTPRAITDGSGNLVWQWDGDPFGKDVPNEQPAAQPAFTFNQRFPGQQFDRESNLHYNYFRDYDPALGRYIQSDPIGLKGGVNTYGYVGGNPVSRIDPTGEFFFVPVIYYGGSALIAAGVAYYGVKAMSRPGGMSRLEERHFDRHCNNTDEPCRNLKAAAATAISEARVKMDAMRNDTVLYKYAYNTPNPSVTNTATTWVGHARDLDGRINNIWAMITLGRKMGCDMSSETTAAMTLLTPGAPNP